MAGAVMTDSTFPPQCGHFFRCGPETDSIFSVWRPHFRHLYSYRGTAAPHVSVPNKKVKQSRRSVSPLRVRLRNMPAGSNSPDNALGCLYLVATPIGNLEDITLRALRVLKEVDEIACEDTRHTQKLLNHYEIRKPLVSYHEHNELTRAPELLISLEQGAKIALVSDAGMPLVSDPGHRLVSLCLSHHVPVVPVPGPSAVLASLAASGLPNEEFLFVGFL